MSGLLECAPSVLNDPAAFSAVLERDGACIIRNLVDAREMQRLLLDAGKAFALPDMMREAHLRKEGRGGYTPVGGEHVDGYTLDAKHHTWDLMTMEHSPSPFPPESSDFLEGMRKFFAGGEKLAFYAGSALDQV